MTVQRRGKAFWGLAVAGGLFLSWVWSGSLPLIETESPTADSRSPEVPTSDSESVSSEQERFGPPQFTQGGVVPVSYQRVSLSSDESFDLPDSGVSRAKPEIPGVEAVPGAVWFSGTIEMDETGPSTNSESTDGQR